MCPTFADGLHPALKQVEESQQRCYTLVSGTRTIREGVSEMRKLRIIIPIAIAVVVVTAIGFGVAFAQGNEKGDSNASRLAAKVAEILGLDAAVVDDAIKQARKSSGMKLSRRSSMPWLKRVG